MRFFISNFKWVMLFSGVITFTMISGLFFPQATLQSNFGSNLQDPLAEIIVRNWSALIGLMGIMLIYGSFLPNQRRFCLIIAGISKVIFISLIFTLGKQYMPFGVGAAVIVDSVMVVLFLVYLLFSGKYTASSASRNL